MGVPLGVCKPLLTEDDLETPPMSPESGRPPAEVAPAQHALSSSAVAPPVQSTQGLLCGEFWDSPLKAGQQGSERKRKSNDAPTASPKRTRAGSRKLPGTPSMVHRATPVKVVKTSEQLELEKIAELQAEAKRIKRLSAESFKRVRVSLSLSRCLLFCFV